MLGTGKQTWIEVKKESQRRLFHSGTADARKVLQRSVSVSPPAAQFHGSRDLTWHGRARIMAR